MSQTAAQSSRDFITFFLREPAAHTKTNKYTYDASVARCAENSERAAGSENGEGIDAARNIRDFLSEERLQCKWNDREGSREGKGWKDRVEDR